jgi:hypothetical protein
VIKSRRTEHVTRIWQRRVAYGILIGKPKGKRPLGKPRYRWENNIKMDPQEVDGWYKMD